MSTKDGSESVRKVELAAEDYTTLPVLMHKLLRHMELAERAEAEANTGLLVRVWAVIPVSDVPYLLVQKGLPVEEGGRMKELIGDGCELLQWVPLTFDVAPESPVTPTGYSAWLDEEGMYRQNENVRATELLIEHQIKEGKKPYVYDLCVHGLVIISKDVY